ncbi:DUF305 domain-containing protein [Micromonospora sp. WMMD964]|uniref:DUF305 domain-containing protein n=1 Tax=Micromonospora sp. WMMD964 TaxID=3016091 RepID=UPI00249B3B01|nr:DUF305 domain-containing protein [Micromonospora sp. WMMD964]WFF01182.1 DUF305 domain-containing protein [Micromonospora sp. WMMD964]WFF01228.1 DUF305 domain-containing protein [Micromonospora sp. WMMD964]
MTAPTTTDSEYDDTPTVPDEGGRAPAARYGVSALAIMVVVGLLLGYAGGLLTPRLTRPGDASVEAGFARDMTTHHAQAVEMSLIAYRSATLPEVRQIAVDIATGQQGEIGAMQTWLREWGLSPTGSQPPMSWMSDGATLKDGLMPGMATPAQMTSLRDAQGIEVDRQFLTLMYAHHLGGIHMIDAALDVTDNDEVLRVAKTMKATQQTELNNLRQLQAQAAKG